jgi:hypothetical protein
VEGVWPVEKRSSKERLDHLEVSKAKIEVLEDRDYQPSWKLGTAGG